MMGADPVRSRIPNLIISDCCREDVEKKIAFCRQFGIHEVRIVPTPEISRDISGVNMFSSSPVDSEIF